MIPVVFYKDAYQASRPYDGDCICFLHCIISNTTACIIYCFDLHLVIVILFNKMVYKERRQC